MDSLRAVKILSDGNILVAGESNGAFYISRYDVNGTVDATFGTGGATTTAIGTTAKAEGMVIQGDGKIVLAGTTNNLVRNSYAIARYSASGVLDPVFGAGPGYVVRTLTADDSAHALVLQSDGKIVVTGQTLTDFSLARFWP